MKQFNIIQILCFLFIYMVYVINWPYPYYVIQDLLISISIVIGIGLCIYNLVISKEKNKKK